MSVSTISKVMLTNALKQCSHPDIRRLSVEATTDAVIVSGRVTCYYHKQVAQEILLPMIGVRELVNRVTVVRDT